MSGGLTVLEFTKRYQRGEYVGVPPQPSDFKSDDFLVAPNPLNENRRNKTLYYYRLNNDVRETLKKVMAVARHLFDVSSILINFLDQDSVIFFQTHNYALGSMDRKASFCSHGLLTPNELFIVPDTHLDWRFQSNPLVTPEGGIRFYAGAPIVAAVSSDPDSSKSAAADEALGMICLVDDKPRQTLTDRDQTLLHELSGIVRDVLDAHLAKIQLHERNCMSQSLMKYIDPVDPVDPGERGKDPFHLAEALIRDTLGMDTVIICQVGKPCRRSLHRPLPQAQIAAVKDEMQLTTVDIEGNKLEFSIKPGGHLWESTDLRESAIIVQFSVEASLYLIVCHTKDAHHVLDVYDVNYVLQFAQAIIVKIQQSLVAQVNEAKTTFMKSISHELRTPLHGILTSAELLAEDILPAQRGLVEMIQLSGKNLINVINGFLDLNRWSAECTAVKERKECFDPLDLQQDIADTFAFSQTSDLSIILSADKMLAKYSVIADAAIAKQILLNVVDNAVKFTDVGCIKLHVALRHEDPETFIDWHVIDTGKGISGKFIDEGLFRPFKKEDEHAQGLGLSLAVSKQLCEATDSLLFVAQSEPGKGTHMIYSSRVTLAAFDSARVLHDKHVLPNKCITPSLQSCTSFLEDFLCNVVHADSAPLRMVDCDKEMPSDDTFARCTTPTVIICQPDIMPILSDKVMKMAHVVVCTKPIGLPKLHAALKTLTAKQVEYTRIQSQPRRVLIVDDNSVNRNMLAMYCRKRKLYFDTACNGLEATEKFQSGEFSVVFMDIQMPICDGPTAVKNIRDHEAGQNCRGSLIVMLTGLNIREQNNAGADAVYAKPVSLKTLDLILGL